MATNKPNSAGGYDDSHHLVAIHQPPASLIALREELVYHPDIFEYAALGVDFEDVLGRIALKLDIALDGVYDVEPLCAVLVEAMRKRRFFPGNPSLRHKDLMDVELVEKEGKIELQERNRMVDTIVPDDAIIKEVKH